MHSDPIQLYQKVGSTALYEKNALKYISNIYSQ